MAGGRAYADLRNVFSSSVHAWTCRRRAGRCADGRRMARLRRTGDAAPSC